MRGIRRGIVATFLMLAAAPALAQQHTSLALPSITPGFTAIYVAQDKGFWKSRGSMSP